MLFFLARSRGPRLLRHIGGGNAPRYTIHSDWCPNHRYRSRCRDLNRHEYLRQYYGDGYHGVGSNGLRRPDPVCPAVVTFQGCSLTGTIFPSAAVNCNIFPSSEFISINVFNGGSTPPASGAGAILKLNFLVIGTQGQSSPLNFVSFNFNEGDPASVTNNGSISLLPVTAAGVTVSGRLLTNLGRPVSRGTVSLTDASGNIRRAQTNTLGYFRFTDVSAGETYLIAATAKGYTFSSSLLSVMDQIADIEILAEP